MSGKPSMSADVLDGLLMLALTRAPIVDSGPHTARELNEREARRAADAILRAVQPYGVVYTRGTETSRRLKPVP